MKLPKKIFIDTSGWIEFILNGEKYHKEVSAYIRMELKEGAKLLTSDYVLDEAFTRLLTIRRLQYAKILKEKVYEGVRSKHILVLWTDEMVFDKAWKYFIKYSEHKLSFTDATIATFVKDLRIDEILTLDRGFEKVGFTTKPKIN